MNEEYYGEIINICIENLKDNSNPKKQEDSLKAILSIFENSAIRWKPYFDYPFLINELIEILIKEKNDKSRLLALKIFGFIGSMDPDTLEKIWSIKIENNFINENYEIDEYNNFDDEEIIDHKRKRLLNKENEKKMLNITKKEPDYLKMISEQELDPCTYYAVKSLMNILKDNSLLEPTVQVIAILGALLKSLQESDSPVAELILPTLVEAVDDVEINSKKAIFDHIQIILKNFKHTFKNYLKEVLDLLAKYITEREFQCLVFDILEKMLEEFVDEMEIYFPNLVPLLLQILKDNNNLNNKKRNYIINKKVFDCLFIMSDKLSNYLTIIIPEILKILNTPLNSTIREKEKDKMLSGSFSNLDENRTREEQILSFFEKIMINSNLNQTLSIIVNSLLKYIELNPNNIQTHEKVLKLFNNMFNKFHSSFLIYLPSIIRVCKYLNINLSNFYSGIKSSLDKNEIVEEIKNRNNSDYLGSGSINIWGQNKHKRNRLSSQQKEGNISKNIKSQIDK